MKKKYVSPLFGEVVLETEDVLSHSELEDPDNMHPEEEVTNPYGGETPGFNF